MAAMGMGLLSVCCSLGVLSVPQQKKHHLSFSRTETLVSQQAAASASLTLTSTTAGGLELQSQSQSQSLLPSLFSVYCGRGDKKTAKGKRFKHSFGNARPRDKKKGRGPPRVAAPPPALSPPKKDKFDDGEIIKIEIIHHDDD